MKKPTTTFLFPTLLLLLFPYASASIDQTCAAVAATRPDIGYDFCVSSLSSTTSAAAASGDPTDLAIAASNLAIANATDIVSRVSTLMEAQQPSPALRDCLSVCSDVFSDAIDHLNDAIRDLRGRAYNEAVTFLSAALDAADDCEEAFDEEGEASPMVKEGGSYRRLADIALTITASLG